MKASGNDVWKALALLLAGGLAGNVGTALTTLKPGDVQDIVNKTAPWVKDKAAYDERQATLRRDLDEVREDYRALRKQQDIMDGKLDAILTAIGEGK